MIVHYQKNAYGPFCLFNPILNSTLNRCINLNRNLWFSLIPIQKPYINPMKKFSIHIHIPIHISIYISGLLGHRTFKKLS